MKKVRKGNIYAPTKSEKKLIEVLIDPRNIGKNVTELCSLAGVSTKVYYKAKKKEGFIEYINDLNFELLKGKVADILNATYIHALSEKGHQDRKMLLTIFGIYSDKQEVYMKANINNPYEELTTEQLKKLAGVDDG